LSFHSDRVLSDPEGFVTGSPATASNTPTPKLDTTVPHSARLWNYWLGGKDNFAVDREVADQILAMVPEMVTSARADREFLGRVVRQLAGVEGIRQFLDIGTGIPTANNTHEVAQRVAPQCRIAYIDNDPLVLAHARALLTSHPQGATDYVDADLRDPDKILDAAARTLDFGRPIAVMMLGILNFIPDNAEAAAIVNRILAGCAPGSFLAISHPTTEINGEVMTEALRLWNEGPAAKMVLRSRDELVPFFDGLELLDPGLVTCSRWRPDPQTDTVPVEVAHYGGVGRKL
jgi:O-methyltransferase involved in polyketide biosynthesis